MRTYIPRVQKNFSCKKALWVEKIMGALPWDQPSGLDVARALKCQSSLWHSQSAGTKTSAALFGNGVAGDKQGIPELLSGSYA